MLLTTLRNLSTMPLVPHAGLAAATFAGFQWVQAKLNASYAASKHPVDYMTGQTGFDAAAIKSYYTVMLEAGTLDVYWATQLIDFGFIVAMACMGLFVCTLVGRLARPTSWGRRLAIYAGLAVVLGAVCDAIENLWSFVMLSNPQGFADWLALPYSGFAVAKFALITLGILLLIASVATALFGRAANRPLIG